MLNILKSDDEEYDFNEDHQHQQKQSTLQDQTQQNEKKSKIQEKQQQQLNQKMVVDQVMDEDESMMQFIVQHEEQFDDSRDRSGFKVENNANLSSDHLRQSRHDGLLRSRKQSEKDYSQKSSEDVDTWKIQYDQILKQHQQLKLDNKVLELRNQKLEEKIQNLEMNQSTNTDKNQLAVQERDKLDLEQQVKELKQENLQMKVKMQTQQSEINSYELQINEYVNLKVAHEDLQIEFNKIQSKLDDLQLKQSQQLQLEESSQTLTLQIPQLNLNLIGQTPQNQPNEMTFMNSPSVGNPLLSARSINQTGNKNDFTLNLPQTTQVSPVQQQQHQNHQSDQQQQYQYERRIKQLEFERDNLMKQIQHEQLNRIEKQKHKLELEARLKTAEIEAQKSYEERQVLERQIKDLRRGQNELMHKIRESQEFMDVCNSFLQRNGLLASSFTSDDPF
eukprot:403331194